jgi:hypothetical protein
VQAPLANSSITYVYDELGRVVRRTSSGATEIRRFDALGRLVVVENALGAFTYAYEGLTGRLSRVAYPNGQATQFNYYDGSGENRLKQIKHLKNGGTNLSTFGYGYDLNGQIHSWSQQADAHTPKVYSFQYDPVGQLLKVALGDGPDPARGGKTYGYGYDQAGNRTSEQIDGLVTTATYNGLNQLVEQRCSGDALNSIAPPAKEAPAPLE